VPGSLSGPAARAAETAGSEPGIVARVRAGLRRRHQEAYLSEKHGNRLALLPGSSETAAGIPETVPNVLASDLNPHEQNPAAEPAGPACSARARQLTAAMTGRHPGRYR
jgi:hypothetical protein